MKKILIAALVCFLSAGPLNLAAAAENKPREELHDEMAAYRKVDGKQGSSEARSRYMKLLSPGGAGIFSGLSAGLSGSFRRSEKLAA